MWGSYRPSVLFFFFSTVYTVCENDSIMVKWVLFKLKYVFYIGYG